MKYIVPVFVFALFLAHTTTFAQRVVVIGLDGFSGEAFEKIKHPNIDDLFKKGIVFTTTRPVMPSVTLPNWTSHFTGSGPEEHGVTSNAWTLKNHELTATDKDEDGYYPSIFKLVKEQIPGIKTAFYYNWAELINSINKKYIDELSFEYNDRYDSNYAKAIQFISNHQQSPQLIFLYSVHTDHAGHNFGWMSPEYIAAIKNADSAIGHFITALKKQKLFEGTYFLFITDHGGKGNSHGGTSMQEMQVPWAVAGPGVNKMGTVNLYNSNKNTALVLAEIFSLSTIPKCWTGISPASIFKKKFISR